MNIILLCETFFHEGSDLQDSSAIVCWLQTKITTKYLHNTKHYLEKKKVWWCNNNTDNKNVYCLSMSILWELHKMNELKWRLAMHINKLLKTPSPRIWTKHEKKKTKQTKNTISENKLSDEKYKVSYKWCTNNTFKWICLLLPIYAV